MTYEELVDFINQEKTGIAKGYDFDFLFNKFRYQEKEALEKYIAAELAMFSQIEKELLEKQEPKCGDFVQYDGQISRLSVVHENGDIQLSETIGVYVSINGSCQASGCVWDPNIKLEKERLKLKNLEATTQLKKGSCWSYSGNYAAGMRGVYFEINFKVWELQVTH